MKRKKTIEFTCINCNLKFNCPQSDFNSHNKKGICDICHYAIEQSNKREILKWV